MNKTLMTPLIAAAGGTLATIALLTACGTPSYPSDDRTEDPGYSNSYDPGIMGPPGAPGSVYGTQPTTGLPPTYRRPSNGFTQPPVTIPTYRPTTRYTYQPPKSTYTYQPPKSTYTYKPPAYTYKPPKRY